MRRAPWLISAAATALLAPVLAQAQVARPSLADSFRIGSGGGALCQAQNSATDPAVRGMFDRAWVIVCRDAAQPVGKLFALRGDAPLPAEASGCDVPQTASIEGLTSATRQACGDGRALYRVRSGRTTYVAQGFNAYDQALLLGLRTVIADRMIPGKIEIATTGGDAQAFARAQAETLDPQTALAEGYRRNNSGNYAEAAQFFDALQQQAASATDKQTAESELERQQRFHEYVINRALQLSNLGQFDQADLLFRNAADMRVSDRVQARLRRNFEAMHLLNQAQLDAALEVLARPMIALEPLLSAGASDIEVNDRVAAEINGGIPASASLGVKQDTKLTPEERAAIIDAQALQLRGTVLRLKGQPGEGRALMQEALEDAVRIREGRVTTIARLRAQIMAEIALTHEEQGDFGAARALLSEALAILEATYPETNAVNGARARLAAFLARRGSRDEAMALYKTVIASAAQNQTTTTGLANQLRPYFDILADRAAAGQAGAADDLFLASQTLVRPGAADTMEVLSRELQAGDTEAARLFRQSITLSRDIERGRIELARLVQLAAQDSAAAPLVAAQQEDLKALADQQLATQAALSAYPQFRAVSKQTLSLEDLRQALKPGEAYFKLAIVSGGVFAFYADGQGSTAYKLPVSAAELDRKVAGLRDTISVWENGVATTYPFDVALSRALFLDLFAPVAGRLGNINHLVFEPDGAMLQLPANLLVAEQAGVDAYAARVAQSPDNEFDFRGVAWLGRKMAISTAVSARSFRDARAAPGSAATQQYLGFGNNAPTFAQVVKASTRSISGFDSIDCEWPLSEWNKPISPAELNTAARSVGADQSRVVTGRAFTDTAIRAMPDLANYRILHFATHGLVTAPRVGCPARPALLTSFGEEGSDGLLAFAEIYDLKIDADLVILSACDTAGQASAAATREAGVTTGGGSALDGLVRAFIGAGGRSVVASHWPAPDDYDATGRLMTGLFAAGQNSIGEAMRASQIKLMDDADTSHPYYWSGLAVIGDGARPLLSAR